MCDLIGRDGIGYLIEHVTTSGGPYYRTCLKLSDVLPPGGTLRTLSDPLESYISAGEI